MSARYELAHGLLCWCVMLHHTGFRRSRTAPQRAAQWTIALAGDPVDRNALAGYVERKLGRRIPKPYCALFGDRSLLEQTLDRTNCLVPAAQTLTVIGCDHDRFARAQLIGRSHHILRQPIANANGRALVVALAMVRKWAPDAVVTITPADHYVAPDWRWVAALGRAQHLAAACRDRIVVLAAAPTELDPDLGYLVPTGPQSIARPVAELVETPSPERARELIAAGALTSTMTCCATTSALWQLGLVAAPELFAMLERFEPFIDTDFEDRALVELFNAAPTIDLSRDLLEHAPEKLLVVELDGIEWSDLRTPDRIERTLEELKAS